MIRPHFLDPSSRQALLKLARSGSVAHDLGRRATALLWLDDGKSCQEISRLLFLDDATIRNWYKHYEQGGIDGLKSLPRGGSEGFLNETQKSELKQWVERELPKTVKLVSHFIKTHFGIFYKTKSGIIKVLHQLGFDYKKPKVIPRGLDEKKQEEFINEYNGVLNNLTPDEQVVFVDAVHPTHGVKAVGCWAPRDAKIAVEQASGRQRLNIHGAINLENGQTYVMDVLSANAESTIQLLGTLERKNPGASRIHVFLDNAAYHHARMVRDWLAQPGRRIELHFIPSYCPHLNPIERLWGEMHKNVTHNECYETICDFADAILTFLKDEIPKCWRNYCESVTDNFRIIKRSDFRVLT
jgi:transposase